MRIDLTVRPRFHLYLSLELVQKVQAESARHYDTVCKAAGAEGGFLIGWLGQLEFAASLGETAGPVSCDSSHYQTLCKIIEYTDDVELRVLGTELYRGWYAAMDKMSDSSWDDITG